MGISESEFAAIKDRMERNVKGGANSLSDALRPSLIPSVKRGMNKWEEEYAQVLENRRRVGEVSWWAFEPMKLRLATGAYYKPDFAAIHVWEAPNDIWVSELEFHEVKGMWREAGRVRIKVAAEHFPFKFFAVTKKKVKEGGGWKVEEFHGRH